MSARTRILALAAFLTLSAAGAALSIAGEAPPEPVPAESLPQQKGAATDNVLERIHASLERSILEQVIRFDNFFGSVKTEDPRQPAYLLRWQNSLRWEEGGRFKYRTSVRATLRLPRTSERIRLVISGESEAEPSAARLPEDPGNPGFDRTLPSTRLVNTELRYGVIRTPSIDLFLGAGVRVKRPLETFVRSRFQYTRRLGAVSLVRFGETPFWKSTDKFGETTDIALERQITPKTLLRWANSGTVAQNGRGLDWGTELSLLQELSPVSAITLAGGVFGVTRPVAVVENYRIFTRYRRSFLAPWLFFEGEPEISWPRNAAGAYTSAFAFTFRVEVVFMGAAAARR